MPAGLHFQNDAGENGLAWPGTIRFKDEAGFGVSRLNGAGGHTPQRGNAQYGEKAHSYQNVEPSQSYSKFEQSQADGRGGNLV
jgi:hypothetical protein